MLIWEYKLTDASVETFVAKSRNVANINALLKKLEALDGETKARLLRKRLSDASKQLYHSHKKSKETPKK